MAKFVKCPSCGKEILITNTETLTCACGKIYKNKLYKSEELKPKKQKAYLSSESRSLLVATNSKNILQSDMILFADMLKTCPKSRYSMILSADVKSPTTTLLLSIFLGGLGVDRFYIGDIGIGLFKLIMNVISCVLIVVGYQKSVATSIAQIMSESFRAGAYNGSAALIIVGGIIAFIALIFCIIDIFLSYNKTKEINFCILKDAINGY